MRSSTRTLIENTKKHIPGLMAVVVLRDSYEQLLSSLHSEGGDIHHVENVDAGTESFECDGVMVTTKRVAIPEKQPPLEEETEQTINVRMELGKLESGKPANVVPTTLDTAPPASTKKPKK
jgi:hypothetical protein